MKLIIFGKKNKFYKKFTHQLFIVVVFLIVLKNQVKSIDDGAIAISNLVYRKLPTITNFPNPFKQETYIFIKLPEEKNNLFNSTDNFVAQKAILKIFDLFGNVIREYQLEGSDEYFICWDGRNEKNERVGKGGYVCVLFYGDTRVIRKLGLLR